MVKGQIKQRLFHKEKKKIKKMKSFLHIPLIAEFGKARG